MREIRFRAWDKKTLEMIEDCGFHPTICERHDEGLHSESYTISPMFERFILMQYTGLKDKNGVEIY